MWALLRRSITGSFHKVSAKHLDRYVEELEWGVGNRDNDHIFVDAPRRIVITGNLTHRELVKPSPRRVKRLITPKFDRPGTLNVDV